MSLGRTTPGAIYTDNALGQLVAEVSYRFPFGAPDTGHFKITREINRLALPLRIGDRLRLVERERSPGPGTGIVITAMEPDRMGGGDLHTFRLAEI